MARERVFVSPGVFTTETDLTFVSQQVGVTTLGVVGEALKGPAFEPIFITNYNEFVQIFGGLNPERFSNGVPKYEASYIAKHYLTQSNQLFVTRILGYTGYDAGYAWLITASAALNSSTISQTAVDTYTADFVGEVYSNFSVGGGDIVEDELLSLLPNGPTLSSTVVELVPDPTETDINGNLVYPNQAVFTKDPLTNLFTGYKADIIQTSYDSGAMSGTVSGTVITLSASSMSEYEGKTLALLRSRASYSNDVLTFDVDETLSSLGGGVIMTPGTSQDDPLGSFTLSAFTSASNAEVIEASLDRNSRNYISRVVGVTCKDKESPIYVEEIYPTYLSHLIENGYIYGVSTELIVLSNSDNYRQAYQTPETPWIVSELRGNKVEKLFKIVTVSDGDAGNRNIKISFQNINVDDKSFDIVVREFGDRDSRPAIVERFAKVTLNPNSDNYVARRVGTADGNFVLRSKNIMLVMNPNHPIDAFPAGFEGYKIRDYEGTLTNGVDVQAPEIQYKSIYNPVGERIKKVYLGVSDTVGIDQNFFNWKGKQSDGLGWTATTKGFHMDSGAAVAGDFVVGEAEFRDSVGIEGTVYDSVFARKFTVAPYCGFDGWDCYRESRTNTDRYKVGKAGFNLGLPGSPTFGGSAQFTQFSDTEGNSDYYAYLDAIRTFENPESVNINVFTTPGIDYTNNLDLVEETIEMVEEERCDSLYIVSSPEGATIDGTDLQSKGFSSPDLLTSEDMVDLLDVADIDSNFTATYWPWVQINDKENNVNVWLPPTLEVVRNIALTDNISFPWFAVAGYTRGTTRAIQARLKLTQDDRDVLYDGRINPMATFSDQGVIIWGNKNLQQEDTALNRINIRRLLLQARKLISAVAVRLLFDQNDQIVRNQFLNLVNPILDNIRRERGLVDFRVELDNDPEAIDRRELCGRIFIKPIPSLEFICIDFVVTPTGASFDNI